MSALHLMFEQVHMHFALFFLISLPALYYERNLVWTLRALLKLGTFVRSGACACVCKNGDMVCGHHGSRMALMESCITFLC